jgi:hypothetical protein
MKEGATHKKPNEPKLISVNLGNLSRLLTLINKRFNQTNPNFTLCRAKSSVFSVARNAKRTQFPCFLNQNQGSPKKQTQFKPEISIGWHLQSQFVGALYETNPKSVSSAKSVVALFLPNEPNLNITLIFAKD